MSRTALASARGGSGQDILEVRDAAVWFGAVHAVDGVDLALPHRGAVGLIGPNGAGKTTLFNAINGFVTMQRGEVILEGEHIEGLPVYQRARRGLGRTFQNVGLNRLATVRENLDAASQAGPLGAEAADMLRPWRRKSHRGLEILDSLGATDCAGRVVNELSGGLRKIVELACVLLRDPKVIMLDEPSSGLSSEETTRLGAVLRSVLATRRVSLLMIEHDMGLAMETVDYIYVLNFGKLLAEGTPQEIRNDERVVEAYLGAGHARAEAV